MAYVIAPDGTPGTIPDADLPAAAKAGYRVRPPTKLELAKERVEVQGGGFVGGLEGVARGLTLGLSDPVFKKAYTAAGVPAEDAAALMKARSGSATGTAGEVGGFVGGLFGPAELSALGLAAKAGTQVATKVAARTGSKVLGKVAAGTLEGAGFGIASAISEDTLDNRELTASHLASAAATGALAGAGVSGALAGVAAGASRLGRFAKLPGLGKLADEADKAMLYEGNARAAREVRGAFGDDILRVGRREGVISGKASHATEATLMKAEEATARIGKTQIDPFLNALDAVAPLDVIEVDAAVMKALKPLTRSPVTDPHVLNLARNEIEGMYAKASPDLAKPFNWQDLFKLQSDLRKSVGALDEGARKEVYETARVAMRDFIVEEGSKKLPGVAGAEFKAALKDYAAASKLEEILRVKYGQNIGRGLFSMTDMLVGGATAAMGTPIMGVATALTTKALRPRWGFMLSAALREAENSPFLQRVGGAVQARMGQVGAALPATFRAQLEAAATFGPAALLAEHTRIAKSADGPEYLDAMGMTPPRTDVEGSSALGKVAAIDALQGFTDGMNGKLDGSISGFLGEKPGVPPAKREPSVEDFDRRVGAIRRMLADPQSAFQAIPMSVAGSAPATAGGAAQTLLAAARFLNDKAPKDPLAGVPAALRRPWEPSKAELSRWYNYVEGIERPGVVLERAKAGTVSADAVEAVKTVYPTLFAEIQNRMMIRLAEWKEPLPYAKRAALFKIFGPGAVGLTSGQVQQIQQIHVTVGASGPEGDAPRSDGRQSVDVERNMETQGQRMERR